jgi:hypothetical protein
VKTPKTTPTETITRDTWEGETATIKTYLSGWDKMLLQATLKKKRADAEEQSLDASLVSYEMALCLMQFAIVGTTLTFDDGTPVQCTVDDFKRLDEDDVAFICQAIDANLDLWTRDEPTDAEAARNARFPAGQALSARAGGKAQGRRAAS